MNYLNLVIPLLYLIIADLDKVGVFLANKCVMQMLICAWPKGCVHEGAVLLGPRAVFNILSHELTYTGTWLDIYLAQGLKGVI
jgi:hypothetical protein